MNYFEEELSRLQTTLATPLMQKRLEQHSMDPIEELMEVYQDVKEIESNLNKAIKIVCKELWDNEQEVWTRYNGTNPIQFKEYKYNIVETHTGRRSYATNLMLDGLPPTTVMKFTGHSSFDTFSSYVNIPKELMNEQVKQSLELD